MATLTTITTQPNHVGQLGAWGPVGAATAWQATSDGLDTTYVQVTNPGCRLDSQVLRLGFPPVSIPAGSKVYSVGLRRRVQSVVAGYPIPSCLHWLRCVVGDIAVAGQALQVFKTFFSSPCPTNPSTNAWVTESLGTFVVGPDGQAWDTQQNLAAGNFFYDVGRGDDVIGKFFWLHSSLLISEVYLDVTYQHASTITVTGPTGTIPDTQPTVSWVYFSADSQPQQAFQVAIYTLAQTQAAGFTPFVTTPIDGTNGFVLGEDQQWPLSIDLTNGQYAAYVQAQSKWGGPGLFTSDIGHITWGRSASGPPPASILNSASFDSATNRVVLTFSPSGASPATTSYTVQASRDGGQSWLAIPSLSYLPANGMTPVTGYDYVAPLNETSQYRVIGYGGTPLQAAGGTSNVRSVTPQDDRFWLKYPANPLLNTVLPVAAPKQSDMGIKVTKRRMQGTFQLLGGAGSTVLPFIVSGPTYGDEYEIELIFILGDPNFPMTSWAVVDELDRTGGVLLLQRPDGDQLWVVTGPGASGQETEESFNALPGDPRVTHWRRRKLILTQVDAPVFY